MLVIEDLNITFSGKRVVKNFSAKIDQQKTAIIGESGSGKSLTGKALLGLVPHPGIVTAKKMLFEEIDLLKINSKQWQNLRASTIAMIPQDPHHSLNPRLSIGMQIAEMFVIHKGLSYQQAKPEVLDSLSKVQLSSEIYDYYPRQLSGGMAQRAMIAMMTSLRPKLIIADEITSALDEDNAQKILKLLEQLVQDFNSQLVLISHDLSLVQKFCDQILVMRNGELIETLSAKNLHSSNHAYTKKLLLSAMLIA